MDHLAARRCGARAVSTARAVSRMRRTLASSSGRDGLLHISAVPTMRFQESLLRLPVPTLQDTMRRYLRALEPLVHPEAFPRTTQLAHAFEGPAGEGPALQARLQAWVAAHPGTSYYSQLGFDSYLSDRRPLPLNFNPQLTWADDGREGGMEQVRRAAALSSALTRFFLTLETPNALEPDVFHTRPALTKHGAFSWAVSHLVPQSLASYPMYAAGAYPLDMSQYARLFATTRVPREDKDELVTVPDKAAVRHIVVQRGPSFFAVTVVGEDGAVVPEPVLAARLRTCLDRSAGTRGWASAGEEEVDAKACGKGSAYATTPPVGALTSLGRTDWAAARTHLQRSSAQNAASLRCIDEALFVLTLDDSAPTSHAAISRTMLHGCGRNRWFDKSLNVIVAANGKAGVCWEHAWGDGVAVLRVVEAVHSEVTSRPVERRTAPPEAAAGGVRPLLWTLDGEATRSIRSAEARLDATIAATRLRVLQLPSLNKAQVKASGLSPDAVMQVLLQLAHWRAHAYTPVTYESASTAAFKHGRTEVIRSATLASVGCCVALLGRRGQARIPGVADSALQVDSASGRFAALKAAADAHKVLSLEAVMGKGVDRHLFTLSTFATRAGQAPSLFADPTWAHFNAIRLSTSTLASPAISGGGFGPVNPTSYATGYGVEDKGAHFHVMDSTAGGGGEERGATNAAANGYAPTNIDGFTAALEQAVADVAAALQGKAGR
jgi:carnitine O-palmitoyltransferase 2